MRTRARPRTVISSGSPGPGADERDAHDSAFVDALAEVVAALLVGVQVLLHPRPHAAQLARELLVLEADLRGEAVAQPLRERGRRARGRDGDA